MRVNKGFDLLSRANAVAKATSARNVAFGVDALKKRF
jgi:hypothetical protein